MSLTKTFATLPRLSSLVSWLQLSLVEKAPSQSDVEEKTSLVVHKAKDGRWCWELVDKAGNVHGRSTAEFVRQEQAVASAALVQCLIAESIITDREGREIESV